MGPLYFAFVILAYFILSTHADVDYKMIGSNMVLQRNSDKTKLWGKVDASFKSAVLLRITHTASKKDDEYKVTASEDGNWVVKLKPYPEGGPYDITVYTSRTTTYSNVMFGDVFFCSGQSNMDFSVLNSKDGEKDKQDSINYPNLRLIHIKPDSNEQVLDNISDGIWQVSSPDSIGGYWTGGFSAVCYYYGRELYQHFNGTVPIGLIESAWGGTRVEAWVSEQGINACRKKASVRTGSKSHNQNSRLYNAMVAPVFNYNILGVLWYQGENNAGDTPFMADFECYLGNLVSSWRRGWGIEYLPFMIVQLANWKSGTNWPVIRAAQERVASSKNVVLATCVDIGDPKEVHPADKKPLSHRLFLNALKVVYNYKDIVTSGASLTNITADASGKVEKITLTFNTKHSLKVRGTSGCTSCCNNANFNAFQVLTDQKRFAWDAETVIKNNQVIIQTPIGDEEFVIQVRYAWYESPECMLYDGDELFPVLPFSVDI
ncbi:sialate O-acetylesterase [Acrasis kona]|uniref:Sialate O-acetylesterase n=1 Tax=Acrasis kona TaxID=1008807 RepID=A0AAW2ZTB6_9EUKA